MPAHDWTRVDAGVFHSFHTSWIGELTKAFNTGSLPPDHYSLGEQVAALGKEKRVVIRHVSNHRVVAMIELVSSGNKDSQHALNTFVQKALSALEDGIHLLLVDLYPPGPRDPQGIHGVIWGELGGWQQSYEQSSGKPLTLVAYAAGFTDSAYVQPLAVGEPLPEMPLFLTPDHYVNTPLEETYLAAYQGVPRLYREQLEGL